MLRDLKFLSGNAPRLVRWARLASVAAVTLVAIGLRPPGGEKSSGTAQAQEKLPVRPAAVRTTPASNSITATAPMEVKYIPADAFLVVAVRPGVLIEQFQKLKDSKAIPADTPFPQPGYEHCEQACVVVIPVDPDAENPKVSIRGVGMAMTFSSKAWRDETVKSMDQPGLTWTKSKLLNDEYEVTEAEGVEARYLPDDRTLIFGTDHIVRKMIQTGAKSLSPLTQTDAWKAAANETIAVAIDAVALKAYSASLIPTNPNDQDQLALWGIVAPFWQSAINHTGQLTVGDQLSLKITSQAIDAASAPKIEAIHRTWIGLLTNTLAAQKFNSDPSVKPLVENLQTILDSHKLSTNGTQVTLSCEADLSPLMALLMPALTNARGAAQQTQQQNNMRQVLLALHNYHDVYGHFPPAVIYEPGSNTPRSWRVEILPYLEQAPLYNKYNKNEPWDSEGNKQLLAQMPSIYRHPSQPANSTNTAIFAAYGKGLIFEEKATAGTKLSDVQDGNSNTIAIVEGQAEIPWTKPEEVVIDLSQDQLPNFGFTPKGFLAGLADGSTRVISRQIDLAKLKALYTIKGGEVIEGF